MIGPLVLSGLAALFAWSAGQSVEMTIPDPDRYRDSSDGLYLIVALVMGCIAALCVIAALHLWAMSLSGRVRLRLIPAFAYLLVPGLLASALPYEGWINSWGTLNSVGYVINALVIGICVCLAWLTARRFGNERASSTHG